MKKPHEVGLSVMQFDKERRCLVEDGQWMVAVMRNYDAAEWEALLTAAPAIARALLEHVEACDSCRGKGVVSVRDRETRTDVECPGCSDDREVLRKAGVLLP